MQPEMEQATRSLWWGAPASVAAHALIVALLIFGLPLPELAPDEPEAITVELVPPPEPAPPPEPEQAEEEPAPEEEQRAAAAAERASDRQVLKPVFEFGEQDAGPRLADDGRAAREEQVAAEEPEPVEEQAEGAVTVVPEPRPRATLTEAQRLYSPSATEALAAMTAMGDMPRDRRAGELCVTEMREQLRHANPPYWPDLLPAYRLAQGTLMEVHEAAFRADGEWYDLAFRCEVDDRVTRVISFAFTVGDAIPRSQWKGRGLPAS